VSPKRTQKPRQHILLKKRKLLMPRPQQAEERKAPPAADAKKGEENAKLGSLR